MNLSIEKNSGYAESAITIVGITRSAYDRPQYILTNSDEGKNSMLKFPGLRFRAPISKKQSLEDVAKERFEEQTGLNVAKMLGLRTIVPTRARENEQWIFRNVFFAFIEKVNQHKSPDGERKIYLADPGQSTSNRLDYIIELGHADKNVPLHWVSSDNITIARIATNIIHHFNWDNYSTSWYRSIPCVGVDPLTESADRPLGCGLAVASIMLFYQPSVNEKNKIILLKRKGDKHPGYAGGKIETLTTAHSLNVDPISCCSEEGAQEYGFPIQPRAIICCACTALDASNPHSNYNSIINYAFVAEPTNLKKVAEALKNPASHLEGMMESYVVEDLDEHQDRVRRGELRMPDMVSIGEKFFSTTPGEKIPLTHVLPSGNI